MLRFKKIISLVLTSFMFVSCTSFAFSETTTSSVIVKPKTTTTVKKVVKKLTTIQIKNIANYYNNCIEKTKYENADNCNWSLWYSTIKNLNYDNLSDNYIKYYKNFYNIIIKNKGNLVGSNVLDNINSSDLSSSEITRIKNIINAEEKLSSNSIKVGRTLMDNQFDKLIYKAIAISTYDDKVIYAEKYAKEQNLSISWK